MWSKLCYGEKWLFLLPPLFLLFLMISLMTLTLPLPVPPTDIDCRSSRGLSSAGELGSRPRGMEPPPAATFQQPLPYIHSGAWKTSTEKETTKHSLPTKHFWEAAGDTKSINREQDTHLTHLHRNKHKIRGIASKRKMLAGTNQYPSSHHHPSLPQFRINTTWPKPRIKPSNHSAEVKPTAQTYILLERNKSTTAAATQGGRWGGRHTNRNAISQIQSSHVSAKLAEHHLALGKHRQETKHYEKSDKASMGQQAVKKTFRDLRKHHNPSEDPTEVKRKALPKPEKAIKKDDSDWCRSFTEQEFTDSDHRSIRISADLQPLPWFSDDDIKKMELLARGEVVSKVRVPAHGQVLQVALGPLAHHQPPQMRDSPQHGHSPSHSDHCQQGHCSLIKRTDDWFEVFAFHLDRVLGLNRSLPAVLRTFHSDILPYRYISGNPRPIVWWDPGIQHLSDRDNDQNSVSLSWVQYQKLLQLHCGRETELGSAPCVGVHHSEWGRLALFDFLLQVNDRLDRYCCGFTPDPTEVCVENLLNAKCGNTKDLLLVHILVRKEDPSRLVFIDNAGRPKQPSDNLNFRLVEGIDQFPEKAASVLQSGCLESLLLRSLYTDREFWDNQGGARGLRPLIHRVAQRGKIILQHIIDNKLRLMRDL